MLALYAQAYSSIVVHAWIECLAVIIAYSLGQTYLPSCHGGIWVQPAGVYIEPRAHKEEERVTSGACN